MYRFLLKILTVSINFHSVDRENKSKHVIVIPPVYTNMFVIVMVSDI